jgi:hypothetical protein
MCDDAMGNFRGMKMSHMIADTTEELLDMCRAIGVQLKWIQHKGTYKEHFDIAKSKRNLAVRAGAVQVTMRQATAMCGIRRLQGQPWMPLAAPETALERYHEMKGRATQRVYDVCSMGVGCEAAGVCYADAHGEPDRCPRSR